MTDDESGLFASTPEALFYLVSDGETVESHSSEKAEVLDEQPGVQATLDLKCLNDPDLFDQILKQSKRGSRWGKDLSEVYRDFLQSKINQVDECVLADELEAQFSRYDADPYESAVLSDAMAIGIDLSSQIQKELDQWDRMQFTRDDLAAAVGIAARMEGVDNGATYGGIIFQSEEPLSVLKQNQSFVRASQNLQQLLLTGLDVALVAPVGGPDEEEVVENTFRSVGSFSVESIAGIQFDISDDMAATIEKWYDRLRYKVADNRVVENVVRPASVTAYDLPDEPWARHFKNAIMKGLQGAYSKKKFNEARFDELWDERISSHPNYDQYRSRRSTFPEIKVTRQDDGITREFRLHHEGPSVKPYICELPVRGSKAERELIEWIERFLNADQVSERRWQEFMNTFADLSGSFGTAPESLVENALLHRKRRRRSLSPLIPPSSKGSSNASGETRESGNGDEWYDQHWSTILSGFEITTQGGVGVIERKRDLQRSLDPEIVADQALYYKLERDIEEAWEYYLDGIKEALQESLTDTQNLSIDCRTTRSAQEIEITVAPTDRSERSVLIEVILPYSEVYVNDTQVPAATVTNTVNEVIDALGTATHMQSNDYSNSVKIDLLYDLTQAYIEVAEFDEGDLVYFDDIIEFYLSLPTVHSVFETPDQDIETEIRRLLGSERYMNRLRKSDVTFHRKGSDQHGSVKVKGDRYIAMELQDRLE